MDIEEAKRRAKSGPLLLLARRAFALGLTFASTVTIARLVSPAEYGLANMALVVLGFAQIFRDFGLTNAVLRKGVISEDEMSFIFWFNAATTVVLALIIAASAPFAARFYSQPVVSSIILVTLIGFTMTGLSGQHRALMGRNLEFGAIALIDSAGLAIGFITTLILAIVYHNVWSIVIGMLVQSLFGSGASVIYSGWRPGPPKKIEGLSSLLAFGANSSVFSISVWLSQNAGPILIGHFLGAAPLGQYNRAEALNRLPMTNLVQPITQATMPLLTRLRSVPEEYRSAYIGLVRRLSTVLFPTSVILMISSVPLIQALLGDRWLTAGYVLGALAPALIAVAIASAASDLFITQDRAAELRSLGLAETVLRVGAIVAAVKFGVVAVAWAFSLSTIVAVLMRVLVAGRKGPVTVADQLRASLPSLPLAAGSGAACGLGWLFNTAYPQSPPIIAIILLSFGAAGGLLAGLAIPASRKAIFEIFEIFGVSKLTRFRRR